MQVSLFSWLLALAASFVHDTAQAAPSLLPDTEAMVRMIPDREYLEDSAGTLSIAEVTDETKPNEWVPAERSVLNFGYTRSAYWTRFDLEQTGQQPRKFFLEIAYPILDHVDIFVFRNGKLLKQTRMGDRLPYHERLIDHPSFVVPLELVPQDTTRVYVRAQSSSSLQIPLYLWSPEAFIEQSYEEALTRALFYGAMLVLGIYNLLLFLAVRDISYFFYVMYMFFITLMLGTVQGVTFKVFWPNATWWNDTSILIALNGMVIFAILFLRSFLAVPAARPWLSKFLMLLAGTAVLAAGMSLVLPYNQMIKMTMALIIVGIFTGISAGLVRWYDRYHSAKYFSIAWAFVLVGGLVFAFNKIGWLPRTWFTENAALLGAAAEGVLLSFALAYRVNQEREMRELAQKESVEAQRQLLAHQVQANEELDQIVRIRTEELELANEQLQKLSHTDGLTGLWNRRSFEAAFADEFKRAHREKLPVAILMIDLDNFKSINDRYGHPFGDRCLIAAAQVLEGCARRPPDMVARYGGEEFVVLLPGTNTSGAIYLAERIQRGLAETTVTDGDAQLTVSASIGVACVVPDSSDNREALLQAADQRLYLAKQNGRNRIES